MILGEQQNTSGKRLQCCQMLSCRIRKDPSALLLLSRHFRSHPLPNCFLFRFYRFSSRSFSFRRSFCLHSAVLHCTMGFILVVLKRVFPWTVVTALSHHHWHGEIHFNLPFKFRLILNFSFTLGRTTAHPRRPRGS